MISFLRASFDPSYDRMFRRNAIYLTILLPAPYYLVIAAERRFSSVLVYIGLDSYSFNIAK